MKYAAHQVGHKSFVPPKYRADIDGLRAVAVLAVVAHHAFPSLVPGGFIGVDIFFVISGFLISTILFENLQNGRFSFAEFYARRIRRLFPALTVVLSAAIVGGWFLLLPDEYKQLGKHIFGGAGFISNFLFWNESGYFDNAAEMKPLLHLWSLGVEEQFYIVWPLTLWLCWRLRWRWASVIVPILIVSFVWNIAIARRHPEAAFFSPMTRFWELLIGAVLADPQLDRWRTRLAHVTVRDQVSLIGVLLVVVGLWTINPSRSYPSFWGLLPALGAAAIIAAGAGAWFNRAVLASGALVWIGLISYPLYLWHWPLLSFARIVQPSPPIGTTVALVCLSIVLAWLTYIFVERPVRFGVRRTFKTAGAVALLTMAGVIGYAGYDRNGFPQRLGSGSAAELLNYNYLGGMSEEEFWGKNSCFNLTADARSFRANGCETITFPNRPTVFLLGDSFSAYLSPGLRSHLGRREVNLFQYSTAYCTPLSMKDDRERCREINAYILEMIKRQKPDVIMLFAQYHNQDGNPHNREGVPYPEVLAQAGRDLGELGIGKIVLLGQMPVWEAALPKVLLRRFVRWSREIPERTFEGVDQASFKEDAALRRQIYTGNVIYISLTDFLCDQAGCLVKVGPSLSKDLIVFDGGHLTEAGSTFVTEQLLSKVLP